jgi:ABC-type multidrug transport system ATPase subunit
MSGLLWVDGVGHGYRRGGVWSGLFSDVSFGVEPGEIVAVFGGRLAGKTTLLQIVAGMGRRPTKGRVWFDGQDLWASRAKQRADLLGRKIVWADRAIQPKNTKAVKYVGMGMAATGHRGSEIDGLAAEALERVGASECAHTRCGNLSVGQQALVGIARGFAVRPMLLVMDDLLDGLGTEGSNEALALLHELVESKPAESKPRCGVLLSASSMEPVTLAHRIWSIKKTNGLKLEAGTSKITNINDRAEDQGSRSAGCA